mmetsp:Transcript_1153/g.1966  ORF Transcript_1153/g.1966 Transcript_1153/m.1966 type:complete len:219 (-) Transcript_1153:301-957(-)
MVKHLTQLHFAAGSFRRVWAMDLSFIVVCSVPSCDTSNVAVGSVSPASSKSRSGIFTNTFTTFGHVSSFVVVSSKDLGLTFLMKGRISSSCSSASLRTSPPPPPLPFFSFLSIALRVWVLSSLRHATFSNSSSLIMLPCTMTECFPSSIGAFCAFLPDFSSDFPLPTKGLNTLPTLAALFTQLGTPLHPNFLDRASVKWLQFLAVRSYSLFFHSRFMS